MVRPDAKNRPIPFGSVYGLVQLLDQAQKSSAFAPATLEKTVDFVVPPILNGIIRVVECSDSSDS